MTTTVYQERANGQDEFFIYVDSKRIRVSQQWIAREQRHDNVKIVNLKEKANASPSHR